MQKRRMPEDEIVDDLAETRAEDVKKEFMEDLQDRVRELIGSDKFAAIDTRAIVADICAGKWPDAVFEKERREVYKEWDAMMRKLIYRA